MPLGKVSLAIAGCLAGGLVALLSYRGFGSREVAQQPAPETAAAATVDVKTLQSEADLPNPAPPVGNSHPPAIDVQTPEQRAAAIELYRQTFAADLLRARQRSEERRATALDAETRGLIEAGFSQERIDSLRRRRDELLAQRQQVTFESRNDGRPETVSEMASNYSLMRDKDLVLREEISDEEYLKYRRAIGKATSFAVEYVAPGSQAEQAGIEVGDQVVRFGSKRVFDYDELNYLAELSDAPGGATAVEVLRDGQTITIALPKGPTGLRNTSPSAVRSGLLKELLRR